MKFRPCIDIHNGKVKQIVGDSLSGQAARENYISLYDAVYYAKMYKNDGLKGGHIALLNPNDTEEGKINVKEALRALNYYPEGLQIGGGITAENAEVFLGNGASHVIITSYVFAEGKINYKNLEKIAAVTGKDRLVLDLSCRLKKNDYYIVTDKWKKFTNEKMTILLLESLCAYCDEFLIHAVDVEGKQSGVDRKLIGLLAEWKGSPITYAGGIKDIGDIEYLGKHGEYRIDFTVGSGLDLFGGTIKYRDLISLYNKK